LVGFLLAFMPLYALGMMGATRRLDHYDASMGWQWLFIVAAVGVAVIVLGIVLQVVQMLYSTLPSQRYLRTDLTGDPWDGRTLEWSTSSPAPVYNFAVIPTVTDRDHFWEHKHEELPKEYDDIELPRNSGIGLIIAGGAFLVGFGLVWHIWWLAIIGLLVVIVAIIVRSLDENTEYVVPAAEVLRIETAFAERKAAA
jgi:cytochrome o ubiquinol oxidase subunit 1